jgi:toxin ParE1/3/4
MRSVHRSPEAEADLQSTLSYLAERSPPAAKRYAKQFQGKIRLIANQPAVGRKRDALRPGLRSVVVHPYVLFYRFTDTQIEIVRVLHGARDLPTFFDEVAE